MNQARYFLPHLLCLTTLSPFWQSRNTGLKSYRLTVFDSLPREIARNGHIDRTPDRGLRGCGR